MVARAPNDSRVAGAGRDVSGRAAVPFDAEAATQAARLYRQTSRPRGREVDLAVAACALVQGAALWTLNHDDFRDLPGLELM